MIGNTLSLGGGRTNKTYQQVSLPPSSIFSTPTTWSLEAGIALPSGLTPEKCVCMYYGDKIFVLTTNIIYVGDLKNKVWETTVNTGITDIASACFYDDYKIFIVENPAKAQNKVVQCISFNCHDYTVSQLTSITLTTSYSQSSYTGSGSMYYPTVPHGSLASVYLSANRCIYFFHIGGCCRGGYWNSADGTSNPFKSSYGGKVNLYLCKYDINNNIITSTIIKTVSVNTTGNWSTSTSSAASEGNTNASNWIKTQNSSFIGYVLNGYLSVDRPETTLTLYNAQLTPTKLTTILLSNNNVTFGGTDSGLQYCPTAQVKFDNFSVLTFNRTVCTILDTENNILSSLVVPVAPIAPVINSLGVWNNSVVFLSSSGLYMMTFIKETPENMVPVWGIIKGQEYVGTKTLEILNKITIQPYWQTCEEDVEICLGEYSSPGYYNLLIKNS